MKKINVKKLQKFLKYETSEEMKSIVLSCVQTIMFDSDVSKNSNCILFLEDLGLLQDL